MNVLAVKKNKFQINELKEFFADSILFSAHSNKAAIQKLTENAIDLALISINSTSDFGLVKYINDNFGETKVVLSIQKEMQDAVSVITKGKYTTVENPLRLKELKNALKNKTESVEQIQTDF
jgi:DNA-binding NtrC family response regulator